MAQCGLLANRAPGCATVAAGRVRLSAETAKKQGTRHPDLGPADYRHLQRIIDRGAVGRQGERTLLINLEQDGRHWCAVIKATGRGDEIYLTAYHRIKANQAASIESAGKLIRKAK